MGYSFGGYDAGRVAAFEKRYAAGVAFAALHWDLHGWQLEIKRRQDADPKSTPQSAFHFRWVMGTDTLEAAIEKSRQFTLEGIAGDITMPFLVVHGQNDKVVPVASAHKVYDAIGSKRKHLKVFTEEEGGTYHVQLDNRQLGVDYIADWIADNI